MAQIIELAPHISKKEKAEPAVIQSLRGKTGNSVAEVATFWISKNIVATLIKNSQFEKVSTLVEKHWENHEAFRDFAKYCDDALLELELEPDTGVEPLVALYRFTLRHESIYWVFDINEKVYDKIEELLKLYCSKNYISENPERAVKILSFFRDTPELRYRYLSMKWTIKKEFPETCEILLRSGMAFWFFFALLKGKCMDIACETIVSYLEYVYKKWSSLPPETARWVYGEVIKILSVFKGESVSFEEHISPNITFIQKYFSRQLWFEKTWERMQSWTYERSKALADEWIE